MKYEIKNGHRKGMAFKVYGGLAVVKAGETRTLKLASEPSEASIEWYKDRNVVLAPVEEPAPEPIEIKDTIGLFGNAQPPASGATPPVVDVSKFTVEHRGRGVYGIMDGETVLATLENKEAADRYEAMSDAEKAAYIEENKEGDDE